MRELSWCWLKWKAFFRHKDLTLGSRSPATTRNLHFTPDGLTGQPVMDLTKSPGEACICSSSLTWWLQPMLWLMARRKVWFTRSVWCCGDWYWYWSQTPHCAGPTCGGRTGLPASTASTNLHCGTETKHHWKHDLSVIIYFTILILKDQNCF